MIIFFVTAFIVYIFYFYATHLWQLSPGDARSVNMVVEVYK